MLSSLVSKLETDVEIKAPASKFYEIFKNKHYHISNVSSDFVQGCELIEGEWGTVGSVIYWKYFIDGKPRVAKELVEAIDDENNSITFKILDGDLLGHFKRFKVTLQSIPKGEGSVIHWTLEYEKLDEEIKDPYSLIQFLSDLSKDLPKSLVEA